MTAEFYLSTLLGTFISCSSLTQTVQINDRRRGKKLREIFWQTSTWALSLGCSSPSELIEFERRTTELKQMFAHWCKNMNWCYEMLLSGLVGKNSGECVCFDPRCAPHPSPSASSLFSFAANTQFITSMLDFNTETTCSRSCLLLKQSHNIFKEHF